ncbi:MAG TPA: PEGA domain-containing protein [Candidatus Limnocylindrales bacterium]|nr:PEGA domain-containing protein [Candidatus Limnocylindrales bacterium]
MKKVIFILISALFLGFLIFGVFQQFFNSGSKKGALQVTSTPESKVYLDDKYIGQTPLCKCESADTLKTGDYTFKLVPQDKSFSEYQEKITVSEGVLTVIDRKFGNDSKSSGSVISLTPLKDKKSTELLIVSIPSKSNIFLDNNEIGQTPFLFKNPTESDHALRVIKDGYTDKTVRIRTPLGYKLTVIMYLSTGDSSSIDSVTPTASPSAALAPTLPVGQVVILNTPTGFLRVRVSASVAGSEIGRVAPGETFELVSEQPGWYQIKLKNGQVGYVSSQYVSKQ